MTLAQFDALTRRYLDEQRGLDYRAALICAVLANVNRNPKKRHKPFTPRDFMPTREEKHKKQTAEEMLETVKVWNRALGGEDREIKEIKDG